MVNIKGVRKEGRYRYGYIGNTSNFYNYWFDVACVKLEGRIIMIEAQVQLLHTLKWYKKETLVKRMCTLYRCIKIKL